MPGTLRLISLSEKGLEIGVLDGGSATLGREPENTIQIDSAGVSRQHGEIFLAGTQWCFRDYASTNGSWLNGERLQPESIRLLRRNDVLKLADYVIQIDLEGQDASLRGLSLILLEEGQFHSESPLATSEATLVVGGPAGLVSLSDDPDEQESLSISLLGPRAMMRVTPGADVVLNTSRAQGERTLADRDSISVGRFQILINDPSTFVEYRQPAPARAPSEPKPSSLTPGRGNPSYDDWQSEAAKRKSDGRRFVFGGEQDEAEEDNVANPASMRRSSFEMNLSQRVPTVDTQQEDPATKKFHAVVYGIVFVLCVLLVVILAMIIKVVGF